MADELPKVVLDTNVVVSTLLWGGTPRVLLRAARERRLLLYTSTPLLIELADTLARRKFARKLAGSSLPAEELAMRYAALTTITQPATITPIAPDPDDDVVVATAVGAGASLLVTGDKPLLGLRRHRGMEIVTASGAVDLLTPS